MPPWFTRCDSRAGRCEDIRWYQQEGHGGRARGPESRDEVRHSCSIGGGLGTLQSLNRPLLLCSKILDGVLEKQGELAAVLKAMKDDASEQASRRQGFEDAIFKVRPMEN